MPTTFNLTPEVPEWVMVVPGAGGATTPPVGPFPSVDQIWNGHDRTGAYHRAEASGGLIAYHRADTARPPFVVSVAATPGPGDSQPAAAFDAIDRIHLVYMNAAGIQKTISDDDGFTWEDPALLISGGTHPAIVATDIGTVIHAAYTSGSITGTEETAPGTYTPNWSFVDQTGAALAVDDAAFHISQAKSGSARYVLVAMVSGAATEYDSDDDCRTWQLV